MKSKNLIFIGLFLVLIVLVFIINYDNKFITESFEEPTSTIQTIDTNTLEKLYQMAKDIKETKNTTTSSNDLDKLSQDIINEIKKLQLSLENQSKLNNTIQPIKTDSLTPNSSLIDRETINEKQLLQNYRIKKMEDKIQSLRKTYQDFIAKKTQTNYPKIPIYSSCSISEPDEGIVNIDTIQLNNQNINGNINGNSTIPISTMSYNPFKTTSTNENIKETPTLDMILNLLQNKDINFNIDFKK